MRSLRGAFGRPYFLSRVRNGAVEIIRRLPNTTVVNLGPGIYFLQEDYPVEIGTGIARWLGQINE